MTSSNRFEEREFPFVTLPLPPTDNQLKQIAYRSNKLVPTKAYSKWKKETAIAWKIWAKKNPDFRPYKPNKDFFLLWNFVIYLPNWRRDAQNHTKALRDGLTGKLYDDDRYTLVLPSQSHKPQIDKLNPRIVLNPNPILLE